jgi:hypothetical protein
MQTLKEMLDDLESKLLQDEDIREMFERNFPDLNYEDALTITLVELYEFALEKDLTPQELSIQGVKLFFANVLADAEDDDGELIEDHLDMIKEDDGYGQA